MEKNFPENDGNAVTNILTVDVEDWYMDTDISTWDLYEDRIVESTNRIIDILKEYDTKATFFILGYVAENFPEIVNMIKNEDHEICTHGYSHKKITQQTPHEFEEDILRSIRILENITGDKVIGHRASNFTVVEETAWAIDILKKNGLKYDSSIFPVKTQLYGVPKAPLYPYSISSSDIKKDSCLGEDFLEIPLSVYTVPILHKNIPIAGGFYLRFFPYYFIKHSIKKINTRGRRSIFYIHPWELDTGQPRENKIKWYHYYNLSSTEEKFRKLLKDFKFTSIKEGILNEQKKCKRIF